MYTAFILCIAQVKGQADCILGVGVTENSVITEVFQLNLAQRDALDHLSTELKDISGELNKELEDLLNRHPQSNEAEIMQLAGKYKTVMDSLQRTQTAIDKKMLVLFNPKQYEKYRSLCTEAIRSPLRVTPTVYPDSMYTKN